MLERPFGSVRWKGSTPDRAAERSAAVVASAAGSSNVRPAINLVRIIPWQDAPSIVIPGHRQRVRAKPRAR